MKKMKKTHYQETIKILSQKVLRRGINYNLDTITAAAKSLGNPQSQLSPVIHIAGTNGKGSTLHYIAKALESQGKQVGTYTSPHIKTYTERIVINSTPISESDFTQYFTKVQEVPQYKELSEFEVLTLMSFLYFKEKSPDIILYETGLGGKLDTTNLVEPQLCIITKIARDHEEILGKTLSKIATDKAGIIKKNTPIITLKNQAPSALAAIKASAKHQNAPFHTVSPLKIIPRHLPEYQKENLSLAQKALEVISQESISIKDLTDLPGPKLRYQHLKFNNHPVILDGAHNPAAIKSLIKTLNTQYPNQKFTIILGLSKDKNAEEILNLLTSIAQDIYYCNFDPKLSLPNPNLQEISLYQIMQLAFPNPTSPTIITGSLYFTAKLI